MAVDAIASIAVSRCGDRRAGCHSVWTIERELQHDGIRW
jgi:hypothetical protein